MTTRLQCPIGSCAWTHDDPGPDVLGLSDADFRTVVGSEGGMRALMLGHVLRLESVVKAHLETHPLLEWVQEVMMLRERVSSGEYCNVCENIPRLGNHPPGEV